ncbi:Sugar phosphate isomerase/epimerase [Cnuella takakiae]|uniref:Sugar phosphate isomerase/epimerase n=1 Tax=Cnuella takakiae TaxID=1302690 RepID=A0A1M4XX48_9BACT|nr:sugar phosphate isomerase/epimerase [Cnuella takakiae]OLY92972.1 sugar phosphate isomerase [Cnuella takakiae]SHE97926.1 Sugar phosphate isomerase/epimerase [Cnuella takakiae]
MKQLLAPLLSLFLFNLMLGVTPICAQAQQPEIGLELYSFRDLFKKDVPGTLQRVKELGIKEIEGGGSYNLDPEVYRQLLREKGLELVSYGAGFEDLEKAPEKVAEQARFYGAKYVVTFWIPHQNKTFTFEDAQRAVTVFNRAGKVLKEAGLSFAYHPHSYEFQPYGKGTFFDYLVKNMDPRYANFQMDVFWFQHAGQNPVAWLKKMPRRFVSLHLKDREKGTKNNTYPDASVETNVVLGTGDVNIRGIMQAAWKIGIRHYFIEDESSRAEVQVPLSIQYLKSLDTVQK